VIEFDPNVNPLFVVASRVSLAEPPESVAVPTVVEPDLNVTVPVAAIELVCAVSVTEAPPFTELGAETVIVVAALFTVSEMIPLEVALLPSPS
jgi:hypothetical protein